MGRLCWAKLLVAAFPFSWWRSSLGSEGENLANAAEAKRFAAHVEAASRRLPIETKCLPQAMALSWMLRRRKIAHTVVIAVRPSQLRQSPDALHAWVEAEGERILGDLPGPWADLLRLGA